MFLNAQKELSGKTTKKTLSRIRNSERIHILPNQTQGSFTQPVFGFFDF